MRNSVLGWGVAAVLASLSGARADSAAAGPGNRTDWPRNVVVTVGDIRTRVDAAKMWTLSGIDYQDTVMAVEASAYGTVITIRGVGHLGTGHFLDVPGKPGEVEREDVTSLRLFIDGQPVTRFTPTMDLRGASFRMERASNIRDLKLESTVELGDGVLVESQHWHATRAIDLQMSYPLMYAWTPSATHYVFGDDDGIQKRGTFRTEGKPDDSGREKTSRWMAVFDPTSGKGSVCYLLARPAGADAWLQWTDAPGVYGKLRIMTFVEQVVPEGFDGTYRAATTFFSATEEDWERRALERVEVLKEMAATPEASN